MNSLKRATAKIARPVKRSATIRLLLSGLGVAAWLFLVTPYLVDAVGCVHNPPEKGRIQCLKPVAQELREDSNIATYATATVAAIIAVRLANRNRPESVEQGRGDEDTA